MILEGQIPETLKGCPLYSVSCVSVPVCVCLCLCVCVCVRPRDDMIKITPTVEIYNRSMVQKHPVVTLFLLTVAL